MTIIAKMRCSCAEKDDHGNENVNLNVVYEDSEENKTFSIATPTATLHMVISNPAAQGFFKQDKEYYLKFEEAK